MAKCKFILPLMLCVLLEGNISACEFHSFFGGTNPLYTGTAMGLRYRIREVIFHHHEAMEALGGDEHEHSGGTLSYGECWGRFFLTKKTILSFSLPVFFNPGENTWLGDPTLILQQRILNVNKEGSDLSATWFAGAGVKFPSPLQKTIDPEAQFITSTGSFDYLVNTTFLANYKKAGVVLDAGYKINTFNKDGFRYGNVFNGNLAFYYSAGVKQTRLMPHISVNTEMAANSECEGMEPHGAYTNLYGGAGIDLFCKRLTMGISVQRSICSSEEGLYEWRLQAGLGFFIGKM